MWKRLRTVDLGRVGSGRAGAWEGVRRAALLLLVGAALHGCSGVILNDEGEDADAGVVDLAPQGPRTLRQIRVMPENAVLEADLNKAATKDFIVQALYSDGSTEDITALATLKLEDAAVGSISGTHFTSAARIVKVAGQTDDKSRR